MAFAGALYLFEALADNRPMTALPIDTAIPQLLAALRDHGQAVLQAPPGAGKTTRVPLALMEAGLVPGRILMLEPRRIAARAAAERMAETLGESPGERVGYRIRGETRVSAGTRIEVLTEGILNRMLQSDPELTGVSAILFDEFHERSLNADLGLALALEVRSALRPDLILLPMSATLDAGPVAELMGGAPVITSEGRRFDVAIRWAERPAPKGRPLALATADLAARAAAETSGGILVFLPGAGEIRAAERQLTNTLGPGFTVRPLYGAMPFRDQRRAIAPEPDPTRRKVVLATSIAETSLTIEDIRVVVDSGWTRRARFDPGTGMSRLVTERVSRAEATQRAGRGGRVAEGHAYRLWTKGEDGALLPYAPPEIAVADLSGLALELALWGSSKLAFLTPPPEGALAEARALLRDLGALDDRDRMTAHGRRITPLPVHPRLAHMLLCAGAKAAGIAALMGGRPLPGLTGADLVPRLEMIAGKRAAPPVAKGAVAELAREARRLSSDLPSQSDLSLGQMAALAYPDRIGKRRPGDAPRYLLSGGRGAILPEDDSLAGSPYLVATDLDGAGREARIRGAVQITEAEIREIFAERITEARDCHWSRRHNRVEARIEERLGAVALSSARWTDAPQAALTRAMCDGVRDLGLTFSPAAERFRARVALMRKARPDMPDLSDDGLMTGLEDWLSPHLGGVTTAAAWRAFDTTEALRAILDWDQLRALDQATPAHFLTPLGRKVPIDYGQDVPTIELRIQELFGQTAHPNVGGAPLRLVLLSPAQRPVQVTTDLPRFWSDSYSDVRKDMRGQYPKHPWPEDPTTAPPTTRTKRSAPRKN